MNILTLDEIKEIIDEAAKLKLLELPSYTVLDLQLFLQQVEALLSLFSYIMHTDVFKNK